MAVSACETNPESSTCVETKNHINENSGRDCESPSNSNENAMDSQVRKAKGKKPEMPRYRPGMGRLQNKNSKVDDQASKPGKEANMGVKNTLIASENVSESTNRVDSTSKSSSSEHFSKSVRNRRPDMQVYKPKLKVAAEVSEKKQDVTNPVLTEKQEVEDKAVEPKKSSKRISNNETKNQSFPKKLDKKPESKLLSKFSESNSPQPTGSWADLMDACDLSNSRSTSDDQLCNGDIDDSHLSKSLKHEKKPVFKNISDEQPKKQRHRVDSHSNDVEYGSINYNDDSNWPAKSSETFHKTSNLSTNSLPRDKDKRFSKNRHASGNITTEKSILNNHQITGKIKDSKLMTSSTENHKSNHDHSFGDDRVKPERRRRDKVEQTLPPRFQKNKAQNYDSHHSTSNQNGIGGILKIPTECELSSSKPDNFCVPDPFLEPQFIHKQLFDPNNPSKPEIINIPAPVPNSNHSYPKMSPPFYAANSLSHAYIAPPVQNIGYIPPPQPAAVSQQYHFMQMEVPVNNIPPSTYLHSREDIGSQPSYSISTSPVNSFLRPAVCYNDIPALMPEPNKRRLKPIVEKNLHEIVILDKELSSLISKGLNSNLNTLKQCRWKLQLRYENIILADPKYCAEKNPEQSLWKTVFHQIIEALRKKLEENMENQEEMKQNLLNIILEGSMFYENLLDKQQETYGFKLTKVLELEHISSACLPEQLRCVLISVQKSLIYLGDLARYKEQVNQTANYGKARSWYLKAQQIAPKNGRPYHQLALLAFNTRRKLDAVYYYMRSLAASNPFLSAKESLLSLFEEAKKKYEQYEKKRAPEAVSEEDFLETPSNERREIWIKHDGSSQLCPADKNTDSSMKNLSDIDLNRRFVTSFLHVHGKLFTKVGMETFPEVLKIMLKEFYYLLRRSPLPITSSRILQLLAIDIFSVTNSSLKENGREQGGSSLLQEQALYTSMAMMSLLMDRCHLLQIAHKATSDTSNKIICDDLAQLLPAVKIWTDWMSCQKCLWAPPPPALLERLSIGFNKDIWASFTDLLTVLQEVDTSTPVISSQRTSGSIADCEAITLEEDSTFAGFVPLMDALHDPAYAALPFDKERARNVLRINRIQFFGDYLCGITPPYIEFNIESKRFVSLVSSVTLEETFERSVLLNSMDESLRDDSFDDGLNEESLNKGSDRDELQVLWSRKEALSRAKEQQEKNKAQVQAVLFKHQSQRPIVIKIKPRYLIPDTNCFIDHLRLFRNILATTDFHLVIPLVVINELDGLARGTKTNDHSTPEHTNKVTLLSRESIHFLEQQFASRHPHLRSITSKGSILDTISFRSEEMGSNKGTNDDLILNCCLNYCKDRPEMYMPKQPDDPISLFREVVLLTDDRNLRVKALAHHVPVRDLLSFLQWANS